MSRWSLFPQCPSLRPSRTAWWPRRGWSRRCQSPDRHTNERHLHVDRVYIATVATYRPVIEPEHHLRWFTPADIADAPDISEDSRLQAAQLLPVAASQPGPRFGWPPGHATQDDLQPGAGGDARATCGSGRNSRGCPG